MLLLDVYNRVAHFLWTVLYYLYLISFPFREIVKIILPKGNEFKARLISAR